jgi:transcriptional regulator with XRE-family HTH domain
MVNIEDFIKRLEIILDYYGMSASFFADKIGVQRSSLSHLLSGRNKPSLDLILKIIENFPEVDLYWILNGKGNFPKTDSEKKPISTTPISSPKIDSLKLDNQNDLFSTTAEEDVKNRVFENFQNNFSNNEVKSNYEVDESIERIVIFYKNGTFKNYIANSNFY